MLSHKDKKLCLDIEKDVNRAFLWSLRNPDSPGSAW